MKCYNHSERDAVAVCKACGQAICHTCSIKTGNGFVCQQSCAESLAELNMLQTSQKAHLKNIKRLNLLGSLFSIGMGLLFIYFSFQGYGLVYDFVLLLGAGFTVYGVVTQSITLIMFFRSNKKKSSL